MYGLNVGNGMGCCAGLGNMPWGHLGEDPGGDISLVADCPGGPNCPDVTVADVATYVNTGNADPSLLDQITKIISVAGPSVQGILQQYQLGQIAGNVSIANSPAVRAAIVGSSSFGPALTSLVSSPAVLIGGAALLFMLMRGRK